MTAALLSYRVVSIEQRTTYVTVQFFQTGSPNANSKILQRGNQSKERFGRISYLPNITRDREEIKNKQPIQIFGRFLISRARNGNKIYMLMISAINQEVATNGPPHLPAKAYAPVILNIMSPISNSQKPAKKVPV
jgi:hypothetical protein